MKILNVQFLAIRTKAMTVVREGEEGLPCDSPYVSYWRERA